MKKTSLLLVLLLFLQTILVSCSNNENNYNITTSTDYNFIESSDNKSNSKMNITEINNTVNRMSIFEKELPDYTNIAVENVHVQIKDNNWIINNKTYTSIPPLLESTNKYASWKVDLSKFSLMGICDDILLFSVSENSYSSVIVALYSNAVYFLVSDDVLTPSQYSTQDFEIEVYKNSMEPDLSEKGISKLWAEHLTGEHDVSMVLTEDEPFCIRFRLKNHPELIYSFSYIYYTTYYCSNLPYQDGREQGTQETVSIFSENESEK